MIVAGVGGDGRETSMVARYSARRLALSVGSKQGSRGYVC
jgi:hypothetical protein